MSGDLISREAVLEALRAMGRELQNLSVTSFEKAISLGVAYECVGFVKDAPAVNAVEVVRCKDCARARALPEYRKPYFADGIMVCALGRGDPNEGQSVVWPDDFCSDGVKVDGDADG